MKSLNTFIVEKFGGSISTPITKNELSKLVDRLYRGLDTKKPTKNPEDYISVYFSTPRYLETSDTYYIKIEDLENHTDKNSILSIFYNLAKRVNGKYILAGISTWNPADNEYSEFATAALKANQRMWHPEWVAIDPNPFV